MMQHKIDTDKIQTINTFVAHILDQAVDQYNGVIRYKGELFEVRYNRTQGQGASPLNRDLTIIYPYGKTDKPGNLMAVYPIVLGYTNSSLLANNIKFSASSFIHAVSKGQQYLDLEKIKRDSEPAQPMDVPGEKIRAGPGETFTAEKSNAMASE